MRGRSQNELGRAARIAVAVLATGLLIASFTATASAHSRFRCAGAGRSPARLSMHRLRTSVLCMVNRYREHYALPPLRFNADLRRSATRHSVSMVEGGYFGHTGPGGSTLGDRVQRAGYLGGFNRFLVGENIGGGVGRFGSPLSVCRAWMHSPMHRANILDRHFRDFGVGVSRGYPTLRMAGALTYTLDFGTRR